MKPLLVRLALCSLLVSVGCAEGTLPEDDAAAVPDTVIVDETEPDVAVDDLPSLDTPDVVSLDTPDVVSLDTPDVVSLDVVRLDTVTPMDVVPVGPVRCTPSTASAVCGARPCVDGYCCNGACECP